MRGSLIGRKASDGYGNLDSVTKIVSDSECE